jgi:hypothetical protein
MKQKLLLVAFGAIIMGLMLGIYIGSVHSVIKVIRSEDNVKTFSKGCYTGEHYGKTMDGVLYEIYYEWYVDHTINEDIYFKIDLIIKKTLAKSFNNYTSEQLLKESDKIIIDITDRLNDVMFAVEPYGLYLNKIYINKIKYMEN